MMTLQEKVGRMFLVGFHGLEVPDHIIEWLQVGKIGGVILFARNVESAEQVRALTDKVREVAKFPPLIAIDQEGGTVARLREGFTESPGAMALSASENGVKHTEAVSKVLADEMRAVGINWTYAPAVDISYNIENPTVGTRSFGSDMDTVAEMTIAAVKGFQSGGVIACAKHFPGLGNTAIDSHLALPVVDTSVADIMESDLVPYYEAVRKGDLATIMTTHTIFSQLDEDLPATLSPHIIHTLLRDNLKFDGVVVSDCMEMKAIADHNTPAESAILGVKAGLDIVLVSHTKDMQADAYAGLLEVVESGEISIDVIDTANRRIESLLERFAQDELPAVDTIRNETHLQIVRDAARDSIVLVSGGGALPLADDKKTVLVEIASIIDSEVVEDGGHAGFGRPLQARLPHVDAYAINLATVDDTKLQPILEAVAQADTVIMATRNAHLMDTQLDIVKQVQAQAKQMILACLRNPYDALVVDNVDTVICTCGDSAPSLIALSEFLAGDIEAKGTLPVALEA